MHGAACISFIKCGMYVIIDSAITNKNAAQKEEKYGNQRIYGKSM